MSNDFRTIFNQKVLVGDGAMGTMLHAAGLTGHIVLRNGMSVIRKILQRFNKPMQVPDLILLKRIHLGVIDTVLVSMVLQILFRYLTKNRQKWPVQSVRKVNLSPDLLDRQENFLNPWAM